MEKDGQVRTATEVWSAGIAHKVPSAKAGRKLSVMHVASCLRAYVLNMCVSVAHGCLYSEYSQHSARRQHYLPLNLLSQTECKWRSIQSPCSQVSQWPVFLLCVLIQFSYQPVHFWSCVYLVWMWGRSDALQMGPVEWERAPCLQ